jgi:hypothetical protein
VHYSNCWKSIDIELFSTGFFGYIISLVYLVLPVTRYEALTHHAFSFPTECGLHDLSSSRLYFPLYMPLYCSHVVMYPNNCWQVWPVILFAYVLFSTCHVLCDFLRFKTHFVPCVPCMLCRSHLCSRKHSSFVQLCCSFVVLQSFLTFFLHSMSYFSLCYVSSKLDLFFNCNCILCLCRYNNMFLLMLVYHLFCSSNLYREDQL